MIPLGFDYVRARTLNDAFKALAGRDVKVVAGGHSLIPMLKLRLAQPTTLVDIAHLKELRGIQDQKGGARIGAATTYRELLASALLKKRYPLIAEMTEGIGDLQVRNRGTIGGGLAHADPASDMPAAMLALDATFNLRSKTGKRSVKVAGFFKGAFETAMKRGELMIEVTLPPPPKGAGMAYECFEQLASGYPMAAAAAVVTSNGGTIKSCSLALTGVADHAFLVPAESLVGGKGEAETVARVVDAALAGIDVNSDIHCPADYRRHLARVAAERAVQHALQRVA